MAIIGKYTGPKLTALASEAAIAITERTCRRIATDVQGTMMRTAQAATPVRYGTVRDSWLAPMVERRGQRVEARIKNPHWLAHLLEYGTQPHEIHPKNRRAELTPEGPRAGAHVAGIHAHHMAALAVDVAEGTLPFVPERALQEWKGEVDAIVEASRG